MGEQVDGMLEEMVTQGRSDLSQGRELEWSFHLGS
jgi:hypothetical protein